ncbi:MAG: IclR family transcriptional regulator [Brachymonas sp.]|nr:IclR family transcriptional regulator [Brachymonas sp.]
MPAKKSSPAAAKSQAGIQSVEVGFALLNALAESSRAMMLRDLAQAAGMSPAKAHRYLVSYSRLGLVSQDGDNTRYDLGPAALKLGLASLERLDAVQLARSRMDDLMGEVNHTVAIAVWGNHGPTIVHWQEPARAVTVNLRLGDVMPLLGSATGRCFAAFAPASQVKNLLDAEIEALTHVTQQRTGMPKSGAQVKALLQATRQQGFGSVVDTLLPGISGLAAPVRDASGRVCLSVLSLGASVEFDAQAGGVMARALLRCAAGLSADLGYRQTAA